MWFKMVIYCWKPQIPDKLIFNMIRVGDLLLETKVPDKLIFNMIKGGAGVGSINDLIQWLEGHFLLFICDVKEASSILATPTPLGQ